MSPKQKTKRKFFLLHMEGKGLFDSTVAPPTGLPYTAVELQNLPYCAVDAPTLEDDSRQIISCIK